MYRSLITFHCHWSSFPSSSQSKIWSNHHRKWPKLHILSKKIGYAMIFSQKSPDFGRKPDSPWPFLGLDPRLLPRWLPRLVPGCHRGSPGAVGPGLRRLHVSCDPSEKRAKRPRPWRRGLVDPNAAAEEIWSIYGLYNLGIIRVIQWKSENFLMYMKIRDILGLFNEIPIFFSIWWVMGFVWKCWVNIPNEIAI